MESISKPELDQSLLRVPTNVKRVLRSGELGTYDVLQLMGNTINASADEVNRATDWVNTNGAILVENEEGKYDEEGTLIEKGRKQFEEERQAAETQRTENFDAFMTESAESVNEALENANTAVTNANEALEKAEQSYAKTEEVNEVIEESKAATEVSKEISANQPYIDEDGYLWEYNLETHQYVKTDKYLRGGIEYPELFVLTDMHLYISPNTSVSQFGVEDNGHLSLSRKNVTINTI